MATWADRNAKARSLGYRNYYDYRIHGYGKEPSSEAIRGETLAKRRGHRSGADLRRDVGPGDIIAVWVRGPRNKDGTYKWVDMLLKRADGSESIYRLTGNQMTVPALGRLADAVGAAGGIVSPSPSLDVNTLMDDLQDVDYEDDYESEE